MDSSGSRWGGLDSDEAKTRSKRTKEQVQAKNRNKYKPRTETRTTPSNQTRRQARGFIYQGYVLRMAKDWADIPRQQHLTQGFVKRPLLGLIFAPDVPWTRAAENPMIRTPSVLLLCILIYQI